ncbi:response regulator transcription factor [Leuconostoc fallax]|uniref:response regulator transcription factor n=1 Tax=Leuconostoc fallax TaxID=1251 RepID=UPI0020907E05|nr:response regulator transcription factor [Leuconostoc fallax]MCO6183615.1 response regulator transcription factor [Leuconostoc fallax]
MMIKIMIVEDDKDLLLALSQGLSKWQYDIIQVQDWQHVAQECWQETPALILMDINLPTYDGFYWTECIRTKSKVPIIFISASAMDPNLVIAIKTGADDYIVKPFSMNVLLAKMQALLRRTVDYSTIPQGIQFGDYQLNAMTNILGNASQQVKLTATESMILKLLIINMPQTVSKQQLLELIWQNGAFIDQNILMVNMSRLRDKLAQLGLRENIVTERGKGYRLVNDI